MPVLGGLVLGVVPERVRSRLALYLSCIFCTSAPTYELVRGHISNGWGTYCACAVAGWRSCRRSPYRFAMLGIRRWPSRCRRWCCASWAMASLHRPRDASMGSQLRREISLRIYIGVIGGLPSDTLALDARRLSLSFQLFIVV